MNDIDSVYDMSEYSFSHTKGPVAVLKKGITKEKGDPIYWHEIEFIIPPCTIYIKNIEKEEEQ